MKLSIGLLSILWLSSAISGEWISAYSRLRTEGPILYICSELVLANETPINVDTQKCLDKGEFTVVEKFLTEYENTKVITQLKIKVVVGNLECRSKLRKEFKTLVVGFDGEVTVKEARWKVISVTGCKSEVDYRILAAKPGHRNVKYMSKARFNELPDAVKKNIKSTNLSVDLGDGYYDYLKTSYYLIVVNSEVLGYLEKSDLRYRDSEDQITALVRYNALGERLGEVEVE